MKISELKKEAKVKLAGTFKLAISINLIHLLITLALTYLAQRFDNIFALILIIVTSLITVALNYGLTASMLKLSRNEEVGVTDFIKIGFNNFKRAFFLSLSIFIRVLIPIVLIIFATTLPIVERFMVEPGQESSNILSIIASIIIIGGLIYLFYKILAYSLSTYILIDNPEAKSKEVLKTSTTFMKGNKLKFIGLIFSFFGWLLLCGILSAIAQIAGEAFGTIVAYGTSLLLTPYIAFTEIGFYEDLIGSTTETVSEVNNEIVQ